jgi:hypothetical protein
MPKYVKPSVYQGCIRLCPGCHRHYEIVGRKKDRYLDDNEAIAWALREHILRERCLSCEDDEGGL